MASRQKFFVLKMRLQEQRPQPCITILGSVPIENGFCTSGIMHDRRMVQRPNFFVLKRRYRNKDHNVESVFWI
jgi:hypothetical protein